MEEEILQIGREMAEEAFRPEDVECLLIYSSMEVESVIRRNKKAATKKRLNTVLARSHKAYLAAMERLLQRDFAGAQELIELYANCQVPSVWICLNQEEATERIATIYNTLSASVHPYDAYADGGRAHVATLTFWLDG